VCFSRKIWGVGGRSFLFKLINMPLEIILGSRLLYHYYLSVYLHTFCTSEFHTESCSLNSRLGVYHNEQCQFMRVCSTSQKSVSLKEAWNILERNKTSKCCSLSCIDLACSSFHFNCMFEIKCLKCIFMLDWRCVCACWCTKRCNSKAVLGEKKH